MIWKMTFLCPSLGHSLYLPITIATSVGTGTSSSLQTFGERFGYRFFQQAVAMTNTWIKWGANKQNILLLWQLAPNTIWWLPSPVNWQLCANEFSDILQNIILIKIVPNSKQSHCSEKGDRFTDDYVHVPCRSSTINQILHTSIYSGFSTLSFDIRC